MSLDIASERVCYVHCNFCNTILAVRVPCSSVLNTVTIRCGHCTNLLSVSMGALQQTLHLHDLQKESLLFQASSKENCGSSSKCHKVTVMDSSENVEQPRMLPKAAQEKKPRVPSAYNRFIKEEIQRIKANNPDISHKEAFSTAAKNWAHFPHIHFGLTLNNSKNDKAVFDEAFSGEGSRKTQEFY